MAVKVKVNIDVMVDAVRGYVDGTELQVAIVVWRPDFDKRGEPVAYGSTSKDIKEISTALLQAVDQATGDMRELSNGSE